MLTEIKKLLKHSAIYSFGNLSGKLIPFLLLPLYTRFLTTKEYGILAIINVFSSILQILVNLGTRSSVVKVYYEVEKKQERKEVISTAFYFVIIISFISILPLWILREKLAFFFLGNPQFAFLFSFALLSSFFFIVKTVPLSVFRAQEKAVMYSIYAFLTLILGIVLNLIFVIIFRENVKGILKSSFLSQFIIFLLVLIPFSKNLVYRFNRKHFVRMLTFGLPIVPSGLALWILTLLDRYFLKVFSTMDVVGIYSLGYKIATIMSILVVIPFSMAWSPLVLKWQREKNAREIYARAFKYFSIAGFFVVLAISLFSREVIHIMTTPPFFSAHKIVYFIVLSCFFHGIYMIFAAGCTLARKTFYFAIATGVAALMNTILNILLIPNFQMMGAAIATVISYFIMTVLMYIFSERYYHIPFDFKKILKVGLITTIIYLFGLFVGNNLWLAIGLKLLLLISYFPLIYLLRVFSKREIDILKQAVRKRIKK